MYDFTCNNGWSLIAKRGNLLKEDVKTIHLGTLYNTEAWTNGFMLDTGALPTGLRKKAGEIKSLESDMKSLRQPGRTIEATQAIYWEDNETARCILATDLGDAWNMVDPKYVGYFLKKYKSVRFMLNDNEHFAIEVFAPEILVGFIMPMLIPCEGYRDAMTEMLIEYGLPNERRTSLEGNVSSDMPYHTGASCQWTATIVAAMHGPAYVAPLGTPPGYPINPKIVKDAAAAWRAYLNRQARLNGTPIVAPTPIYQPTVGESVFIVLRHENGTTTDRVVDVQRVKLVDGAVTLFRGYDRRRDRCRNYLVADCAIMRAWDGQEVYDANGRTVVQAA